MIYSLRCTAYLSKYETTIRFRVGWFTMMPMLQDLDSLAARLGQLVQFTRQLQTERVALHARIKSLEQERNALREQLEHRESEHQAVIQRLEQHDSEVDAVRQQSEATHAQLRTELYPYQTQYETMKEQLLSSQSDASIGNASERESV